MKYYQLHIDTDGTIENYNQITDLLEVRPKDIHFETRFGTPYSLWIYEIGEDENDPPVDFIEVFLNLLEPKYETLKLLGVEKTNILFWLLYEYESQCAMEFHPREMKRLGENGIHLNIDCWQH